MRTSNLYHPSEAEALACFELKLHTVMETYFRALRERVVALAERDGTLPVTFWLCEHDALVSMITPVYEAGMRLGMEVERPARAALNTFINLNIQLQTTIQRLAGDLAQEITVTAANRVSEMLNMGLNAQGLPDRLRDELRAGVLSDTRAQQYACQQIERIMAAGRVLAQPVRKWERIATPELEANRLCI
jgi:hypothetical protein